MASRGLGLREQGGQVVDTEPRRRFLLVIIDAECEGGALHLATMHSIQTLSAHAASSAPTSADMEQWIAVLPFLSSCPGWMCAADAHRVMQARKSWKEGSSQPWGAENVLQLLRAVHGHRLLDIVWVMGGGLCPESGVGLELYRSLSAARDYCGARLHVVYDGSGGQAKDWCLLLDGEAVHVPFLEGERFQAEVEERIFCRQVAWRVDLQMPCMTDSGPSLTQYNIRLLVRPYSTDRGQHHADPLETTLTERPAKIALESSEVVTRTRWQLLVLKTVDRSSVPLHLLSQNACVVEADLGPPQEKAAHFMKRWSTVGNAAMLCRMRCLQETSGSLWTQDLVLQQADKAPDSQSQQIDGRLVLLMWDPQCVSRLLAVDLRCESSSLGVRSCISDFLADAWDSWLNSKQPPAAIAAMPVAHTHVIKPIDWAQNLDIWNMDDSGEMSPSAGACGDASCWCCLSARPTPCKEQGAGQAGSRSCPRSASKRVKQGSALQDKDEVGSGAARASLHHSPHAGCCLLPSEELRRVALDWVRCRDSAGARLYDLRTGCSQRGGEAAYSALAAASFLGGGRGGEKKRHRNTSAASHEISRMEPNTSGSQAFLPVSAAVFVRCVRQRRLMKPDSMQSPRPPPRSSQQRLLDYDLPYPPPLSAHGDYCRLPEGCDRETLEGPLSSTQWPSARRTHGIDPCPDMISVMEAMEAAIKLQVPANKRGSIFTDLHTSVTDTPGSTVEGSKRHKSTKNSTRLQQTQGGDRTLLPGPGASVFNGGAVGKEVDKIAHQQPTGGRLGGKAEVARLGTSWRAAELSRQSGGVVRSGAEGAKHLQAKSSGGAHNHAVDGGVRVSGGKAGKDEEQAGKPAASKKRQKSEEESKNKHAIKIVAQQVLAEKIGRQHPKFQSHFKLLYEYSTLMLKSQFEHDFTTSVIAESDVRLAVNRMMAKAMPFTIGMQDLLGTPVGDTVTTHSSRDGVLAEDAACTNGGASSRNFFNSLGCQVVFGLNFSP